MDDDAELIRNAFRVLVAPGIITEENKWDRAYEFARILGKKELTGNTLKYELERMHIEAMMGDNPQRKEIVKKVGCSLRKVQKHIRKVTEEKLNSAKRQQETPD